MPKRFKLAILISHPIQYQAPLYKLLSNEPNIDLTVLFCSDFGLKEYKDKGFGEEIKWDIPLLDGYKYKFLKNISPFPNVSHFWGLINPEVVEELKNNNYDAIWIHGWRCLTDWFAMLSAFKLGIPVLLRGEANVLERSFSFKCLVRKFILKNIFRKVFAFLSIGTFNTEFYKNYDVPKEKIFLVPYIVNNDFFISNANKLISQKDRLKQKYNIPKDLPIILFSGKLIDNKKPLDLLKAYELVLKEINAVLIYLGDGELRKEIEKYIKTHKLKNVYLMGFKNQTELPEFYAMADIFVLPSSFEPWGLVVNEAMCFGLPVIVSDQVGASGDLVKGGVNGYIYSSKQAYELSDKLKVLLKNKILREEFGKASLGIIKNWSYKECVHGLLSCLKALRVSNENN